MANIGGRQLTLGAFGLKKFAETADGRQVQLHIPKYVQGPVGLPCRYADKGCPLLHILLAPRRIRAAWYPMRLENIGRASLANLGSSFLFRCFLFRSRPLSWWREAWGQM